MAAMLQLPSIYFGSMLLPWWRPLEGFPTATGLPHNYHNYRNYSHQYHMVLTWPPHDAHMTITWCSHEHDATTLTYSEGYIGYRDPVSGASPLQVAAIEDTVEVIRMSVKCEHTYRWAYWAIPVCVQTQ